VESLQELFSSSELLARSLSLRDALPLLLEVDELSALVRLGVRVETEHDTLVLEWVLLLCVWSLGALLAGGSENALDFSRVDDALNIWVGDLGGGEGVVFLDLGSGILGSVDRVEELEGALGPDAESSKVTTRCELEEVESSYVCKLYTWDVSEGLDDTVVLCVNDERTTSLLVTTAAHLSLSCSSFAAVADLGDIVVCPQCLKGSNGSLGLVECLDSIADNQRYFLNLLNSVSSGQNERWDSCSSDG